jgi:uncharacterized protein YjbI with pentapeptide repeats
LGLRPVVARAGHQEARRAGSADRFQTLWFSFLGLTLYLAIAALATTHRNLLLGEPQVLPILNIKVELLPFYVIAPLLYLVFHFYLLMVLALLARTAAEFDKQLRTTLAGEPERERYRAQVGNALFLQLLVGMKGERTGVNALLMGLIALITVVLAPLATLVLMQMMFLPYHHLRITWWHRAIVVADLVLIVVMTCRCFFPRGLRKAPLVLGALSRKPRWATAMAFCVLLAVGLFLVTSWLSFQQGRWAGEPSPSSFTQWAQWMEGTPATLPDVNPDYSATEDGVVFHLFPDRLKLTEETIVGKEKWDKAKGEIDSRRGAKQTLNGSDFVPTINLGARDLQAAVFTGTDLRGVSLTGATMRGANLGAARFDGARLYQAQFQGANLENAQLQSADLRESRLEGDDLQHAQLQSADLRYAQLVGADLLEAQLQGANLGGADLRGADLRESPLQGANLESADLRGANLQDAHLQGANLHHAQLQSADLHKAQLQGANVADADLRGAGLSETQLQGADLSYALLMGANLFRAQLLGADLSRADLADSYFNDVFVFRTNIADAKNLTTAAIQLVHADEVKLDKDGRVEPLEQREVDDWIASSTQFAAEKDKGAVKRRFDRLKQEPGFQTPEKDAADASTWATREKQSQESDPVGAHYRERLAAMLGELACDAYGAPHVARGLIGSVDVDKILAGRLAALRDQLGPVRERMKAGRKDPEKCKGVVGLTEYEWKELDAVKPAPAGREGVANFTVD